MKKIKFCGVCKEYTLKNECPTCGEKTGISSPPRFKERDFEYSKYRRMMKNE